MAVAIKEKVKPKAPGEPKFRDPATMTEEELTDPDYGLKKLARDFGNGNEDILTCSKCHHCRQEV